MLEAEVYSCESSPEYMDFDLEDLIYSVDDLSVMEELFQLGFVSNTKVFLRTASGFGSTLASRHRGGCTSGLRRVV